MMDNTNTRSFAPPETVEQLQQMGLRKFTATEIKDALLGQGFLGHYFKFEFLIIFNADGSTEGRNNVGTYDAGKWVIDSENNTLQLSWDGGWYDTITDVYKVGDELRTYDAATGVWGSTLKQSIGHDTAKRYIDNITTFDGYDDLLFQAKQLNL